MPVDYDTHELAWAAGFWDGEGYTGCTPRKKNGQPQVCLKISQSGDPSLLYRFQNAVGGIGTVNGPYDKGTSKVTGLPFKPVYTWSVDSLVGRQQVMACMWPWLGTVKQDQFISATLRARSWFKG